MKGSNIIKLLGLGVFAFFIRAIPHMFVIPYVGIEEGFLFLLAERLSSGIYSQVTIYPHTAIFGVVGLYKLTRLPIIILGSFWSPLMGGLSVVVMYFILRDVVDVRDPFPGVLLFATLDSHIYRSTMFGNAAEATGIFLLLIFIWVYHIKSKFLALLFLPLLFWTHLIVFGMSIILGFSELLSDTDRKRGVLFLLGAVAVSIMAFVVFAPYDLALANIKNITSTFNTNILSKLNLGDVYMLISTLLGTIIIFGLSLVFGKKRGQVFISSVLIALIGILSLFWYSMMISPYRVMIYAGILGVMGYSKIIESQRRRHYFTIFLVSLMLLQVSFFGWGAHNKIFDAVTSDEYDMVLWLKENDPSVRFNDIYWDDPGDSLLILLLKSLEDVVPNMDSVGGPVQFGAEPISFTTTDGTEEYFINITSGDFSRFKYIIYSDRFARGALFRFPGRGGRVIYERYPIVDVWVDDPNWEIVYEGLGGRIYRRDG